MRSREIALCGVLTAAAIVILLLGGLIPMATFCAPLLAMAVLLPVLSECGSRTAGAAYGATAILALLLVPDRELALVYVFFGWYPLLRPHIAALRSRLLRFICRLAVCNLLIVLLYGVVISLLGLGAAAELPASALLTAALVFGGNVTFLLMDLVLARLTLLWQRRIRRQFFKGST